MSPVVTPQELTARRKTRQGIVVSAARDKTITVMLESARAHPVYKKTVRRSPSCTLTTTPTRPPWAISCA